MIKVNLLPLRKPKRQHRPGEPDRWSSAIGQHRGRHRGRLAARRSAAAAVEPRSSSTRIERPDLQQEINGKREKLKCCYPGAARLPRRRPTKRAQSITRLLGPGEGRPGARAARARRDPHRASPADDDDRHDEEDRQPARAEFIPNRGQALRSDRLGSDARVADVVRRQRRRVQARGRRAQGVRVRSSRS